jgi:hypothetical protein
MMSDFCSAQGPSTRASSASHFRCGAGINGSMSWRLGSSLCLNHIVSRPLTLTPHIFRRKGKSVVGYNFEAAVTLAGKVKTSSREESVSAEIEMDLMVDNEPDVNINITEGNNLPFVSLINEAILNHVKSSIAQFITDLAAKAEGQKNKVEVRDTNAYVHIERGREGIKKRKREREREREREMYIISAKRRGLHAGAARQSARKH